MFFIFFSVVNGQQIKYCFQHLKGRKLSTPPIKLDFTILFKLLSIGHTLQFSANYLLQLKTQKVVVW